MLRRLIAAPCFPSLIVGACCRDCFYVYFTHRFRAMFGRSKLVRSGDKVKSTPPTPVNIVLWFALHITIMGGSLWAFTPILSLDQHLGMAHRSMQLRCVWKPLLPLVTWERGGGGSCLFSAVRNLSVTWEALTYECVFVRHWEMGIPRLLDKKFAVPLADIHTQGGSCLLNP